MKSARVRTIAAGLFGIVFEVNSLGQTNTIVLTGLVRHLGEERAFFKTWDGSTLFSLSVGDSWGTYRLISVDFPLRSAVLEEQKMRWTLQLGTAPSGLVVSSIPPSPFETPPEELRDSFTRLKRSNTGHDTARQHF